MVGSRAKFDFPVCIKNLWECGEAEIRLVRRINAAEPLDRTTEAS